MSEHIDRGETDLTGIYQAVDLYSEMWEELEEGEYSNFLLRTIMQSELVKGYVEIEQNCRENLADHLQDIAPDCPRAVALAAVDRQERYVRRELEAEFGSA
jgi:hypothetical protein